MRETSWGRVKYRTTNWKAYNAALKARGELTIWLDRDMQWLARPTGKRGRCGDCLHQPFGFTQAARRVVTFVALLQQ
ncbi:hypothetical protein ACPA1S_31855, partial [Pseudomonas fortuita]